jgi:hypothetical protein
MAKLANENSRALADATFERRERQKADAPIATREYYDNIRMLHERTKRLREERLARERQKSPPASEKKEWHPS